MSARSVRAVALVVALALAAVGCAAPGRTAPQRATPGEIAFIDIDTFDRELAEDMRGKLDAVTVRFPNQPATVNDLPPRLQKWLSAVHRHGGGVSVETSDGYASKDVALVLSILVGGYKLVRDNMPSLLGRGYRAVITLDDGADGVVERVDFVRL